MVIFSDCQGAEAPAPGPSFIFFCDAGSKKSERQRGRPRRGDHTKKKPYKSKRIRCWKVLRVSRLPYQRHGNLLRQHHGNPKGSGCGRLFLLTFFGEAKKVSGCRAAPGADSVRRNNRINQSAAKASKLEISQHHPKKQPRPQPIIMPKRSKTPHPIPPSNQPKMIRSTRSSNQHPNQKPTPNPVDHPTKKNSTKLTA